MLYLVAGRAVNPDPDLWDGAGGEGPYNSFADIADPDGNTWVLQENPNAG
jgi:hypothetical protein